MKRQVTMRGSMTDSCVLPDFSIEQAERIARELYALEGSLKQLDGERDLNFLLDTGQEKFVLKIANATENPAMLECQHEVFRLLDEARVFPRSVTAMQSVQGKDIECIAGAQGEHACRVLPFIEGRMLAEFETLPAALLEDLGHCLGRLDQVLHAYSHRAVERPLLWDFRVALQILNDFKPLLVDEAQRTLVEYHEAAFRQSVEPVADQLRRQVIHNDANRGNVIVDNSGGRVLSVIDFGDMIDTWLVSEPAIAASYAMLGQTTPVDNAAHLLRGYHTAFPLTNQEIGLIPDLVRMRLCMSVCICAHQRRLAPDNAYLSVDEADAWDLLTRMQTWDPDETRDRLREACRQEDSSTRLR